MISYETIYRFIYAQLRRTSDYSWRRYLPRGKSKRGYRGKKEGSPASFIEGRLSLAERPVEAADRNAPRPLGGGSDDVLKIRSGRLHCA
ncbi:IS30 family transposase [Bradyrhizobium sp. USDA 3397]